MLCYHVDKFPVSIITGPLSATLPCKVLSSNYWPLYLLSWSVRNNIPIDLWNGYDICFIFTETNLDMISFVTRFPSPGLLCGCFLHQLQTWSVFLLKYYKSWLRTCPRWQRVWFACFEITSCFSYNLATFPDNWGKLLCEMLTSDKHRKPMNLSAIPYSTISVKL